MSTTSSHCPFACCIPTYSPTRTFLILITQRRPAPDVSTVLEAFSWEDQFAFCNDVPVLRELDSVVRLNLGCEKNDQDVLLTYGVLLDGVLWRMAYLTVMTACATAICLEKASYTSKCILLHKHRHLQTLMPVHIYIICVKLDKEL